MTGPILGPGDHADKGNSINPDYAAYAAYVQANTGLIESPQEITRFRESAVRIGVWNAVRIADSHEALRSLALTLHNEILKLVNDDSLSEAGLQACMAIAIEKFQSSYPQSSDKAVPHEG